MKNILILLSLFFTSFNTFGQFQKIYGDSNNDVGNAIIPIVSGICVGGYTTDSVGDKNMLVFSLDLNGAIQWSTVLGGSGDDEVFDMKNTSDGGYIITGQTSSFIGSGTDSTNAFIAKLNITGNVMWSKVFGGNAEDLFYSIEETSDSGFIAAGFTKSFGAGNKDVFIVRTDKLGNLQWSKAFGGTGNEMAYSVHRTLTNNFILAGSTSSYISGNQVSMMKIDGAGNLLWANHYSYNYSTVSVQQFGYDIIESNSGEYVLTGSLGVGFIGDAQPFIMNTDTNGTSINWCYWYLVNSGNCSANSIKLLTNGDYILGGTMGVGFPLMVSVTATGQFENWMYYYSTSSSGPHGIGNAVVEIPGQGFMLTGYLTWGTFADTSLVLIKTNPLGVTSCNYNTPMGGGNNPYPAVVIINSSSYSTINGGTSFSITPTVNSPLIPDGNVCNPASLLDKELLKRIDIMPNPFGTEFTVTVPAEMDFSNTYIELFDCLGRKIMSSMIYGTTTVIERGNLNSGIYLYVIRKGNNEISRGKIIAE